MGRIFLDHLGKSNVITGPLQKKEGGGKVTAREGDVTTESKFGVIGDSEPKNAVSH